MTFLEVTNDGPVRTLTLNGLLRLNSISAETADSIHDEVLRAERDSTVSALVLTGAGEHFSAGGDAQGVLDANDLPDDDAMLRFMRSYQRAARTLFDSPLPIIAAVSGIAYGGAFNLALACDLVVCSRNARFCQVFLRRGVVPDFGGAWLLPRLVGMRRAKELMFLADEIDALQAEELGLINMVVDTPEAARVQAWSLAHRIAAEPRFAVSLTKRLLHESAASSISTALEMETLSQTLVLGSRQAQASFATFRER